MAQRKHYQPPKKHKPRPGAPAPPAIRSAATYERKAPVVFGKPIIIMEDEQQNTFIFKGGAWVRHDMSIAECKQDCQVKELPQKVNRMTRYEVRYPTSVA